MHRFLYVSQLEYTMKEIIREHINRAILEDITLQALQFFPKIIAEEDSLYILKYPGHDMIFGFGSSAWKYKEGVLVPMNQAEQVPDVVSIADYTFTHSPEALFIEYAINKCRSVSFEVRRTSKTDYELLIAQVKLKPDLVDITAFMKRHDESFKEIIEKGLDYSKEVHQDIHDYYDKAYEKGEIDDREYEAVLINREDGIDIRTRLLCTLAKLDVFNDKKYLRDIFHASKLYIHNEKLVNPSTLSKFEFYIKT